MLALLANPERARITREAQIDGLDAAVSFAESDMSLFEA
jgi:hypothetical protein